MFYLRPCANCGVLIQGGRNLFCTELCRQAAKAVRYARGVQADGRIEFLDVQEAVDVKIAFVAGGGYDERGRRLTTDQRVAVMERSSGLCVECGAPGDEVDHIRGPSADSDNLQLLCRSCHQAKTNQSFHPAPLEMVRQVHRPLWERIGREVPLQPSDTPGWAWRQWASTVPGKTVATRWLAWSEDRPAATPEIAAAGFPGWLQPQLWFGEGKPIP